MNHTIWKFSVILMIFLVATQSFAWHDKTHLSVARAAGLASWYNAAGADMAKIKAGHIESYNHFFNNVAEAEITAQMVMDQAERYNQRNKFLDSEGHLLGAVIASLDAYEKDLRRGKYAEYHLDYCAHYIADLSQPLHNIAYDDFNRSFHSINDGIVDSTIFEQPQMIPAHMYDIKLNPDHFKADLASEVARIANLSRKLAYKLRKENRAISRDEAYVQLGHSASLLKAVVHYYKQRRQEEAPPAVQDGR